MKVFVSTAITGGRREYVEAVRAIVNALEEEGVEVLNARVSDPTFPQPGVDRDSALREVYQWLQEADALVAEATVSSTGVGCELSLVQARGKPVLLLYDAHFGFRISDWVLHHPAPNVATKPYRDLSQLKEEVRTFVRGLKG
ncbi:MAG: DUF4406 domain-containing protein [candidate division WOR-3 bacterium]